MAEQDERMEWLIAEHGDSLLWLCFLYLGDRAMAEDALQDTLLKAHRAWDSFRGESSEKTWLSRIAVNTCKSIRRYAWMQYVDRSRALDSLPEPSAPFEPMDDTVVRAVMALPKRQPVRRLRPALALSLALVLLASVAFALTEGFGLLRLMRISEEGRLPVSDQAGELISHQLASHRFEHTEVVIEEALFDGRILRAVYSVRDLAATGPLAEPGTSLYGEGYRFEAAERDGLSWQLLDDSLINGESVKPTGSGASVAG